MNQDEEFKENTMADQQGASEAELSVWDKGLRPCPFCGMREATMTKNMLGIDVVQCQWCGGGHISTMDWNTRELEDCLSVQLVDTRKKLSYLEKTNKQKDEEIERLKLALKECGGL